MIPRKKVSFATPGGSSLDIAHNIAMQSMNVVDKSIKSATLATIPEMRPSRKRSAGKAAYKEIFSELTMEKQGTNTTLMHSAGI